MLRDRWLIFTKGMTFVMSFLLGVRVLIVYQKFNSTNPPAQGRENVGFYRVA